jgi:hypothetical protein
LVVNKYKWRLIIRIKLIKAIRSSLNIIDKLNIGLKYGFLG